MNNQSKKQWTSPHLTVLGDVKELTRHRDRDRDRDFGDPKNKHFGASDGFVFTSTPISG